VNKRGRGRIFPRSSRAGRYLSIILGSLFLAFTLLPVASAQETGDDTSRSGELIAPAAASYAEQDLIAAVEDGTARLAGRLRELFGAGREAADAFATFWQWLTRDGSDPWAPARALAVALVMILVGGLAQAAAARALTKPARRWARFPRSRVNAAVFVIRGIAFLAAAGVAHALIPEVSRPSRLTSLVLPVIVVGTWMGSHLVIHAIAPFAPSGGMSAARLRTGLLQAALVVGFSVLLWLALLREAGVPADPRLIIGMAGWLFFSALLLAAFGSVREPAAANDGAGPGMDGLDRFIDRHGARLIRSAVLMVVVTTPVIAVIRGPTALWSGMGSLVLIVLAIAMLGLARRGRVAAGNEGASRSPWAATLRRALQIIVLTVFALALTALWDIDLFGRANLHLGESAVRGAMTATVTLVIAYLTWEVIRTALGQSLLPPARAGIASGEGTADLAATRLQTFAPVLRNFLFVVVITVATLVCLAALGINITPLLAGAGVIGIALGFGAQTLVRDVISGVFFLAEDAFRIGEYISIGNTRGTVEGIAIRSLKLRHHRGPVHTVPFGEIKQLTNYSRDWIIMKMEFLLAFDTDLRKVKKLVRDIGKELEGHPELGQAVMEPLKSQGVRRMEPAGMVVGLKFMGKPGSEVYALRREIYQRVRDAFEQNGVRFARTEVFVAGSGDPAAGGAATASASSPATRLAEAT
jgi:small-conductance mechanosensitive channel